MLLNIVKLRYVDAPTFIDVGSIVSSYTLSETATAIGTIVPGTSGSGAGIGLGGSFSNSPTITFTPLTGSKFIQGLLTPLPPTAVFNAIQNGSPAHLILLSTVISINGLKNQQATLDGIKPADPEFDQVRALMRKIQLSGGVRLYVKPEANREPASILALRRNNIDPETLADIKELRRLLKLSPDAEEFTLVQAPISSSDTEIAILTRSIISLMQNMAAQVEVPAEDLAKNHAFPGYETIGDIPDTDRMIRIRSAKQRSNDAFVTVNYRKHLVLDRRWGPPFQTGVPATHESFHHGGYRSERESAGSHHSGALKPATSICACHLETGIALVWPAGSRSPYSNQQFLDSRARQGRT